MLLSPRAHVSVTEDDVTLDVGCSNRADGAVCADRSRLLEGRGTQVRRKINTSVHAGSTALSASPTTG